jgi:hypothetical protein
MPTYLSRSTWTKRGPVRPLVALRSAEVKGIAIHWPGTTGSIGDPGLKSIAGRLDGYRGYHTAPPPVGRGWSDIAYSIAVDQAGRVWDLRGIGVMSAANGDQATNKAWVAVLVLVGPGEHLTKECIEGVKYARDLVLVRFPGATAIKGHQDVRPSPTECPGPLVEAAITHGVFLDRREPPKASYERNPLPILTRYLRLGVTGKDVEVLQRKLNIVNRKNIRVDGDFGPLTKAAVKSAQRSFWPLSAWRWDGIVGPKTAAKLGFVFRG